MNMSDPVMRRAMFRQGGPVSSKGTGITSNVTTPEQNAVAMQTMLQPTIGFRDGGTVQYFQEGGPANAPEPEEATAPTPIEALRAQVRTSEPRYRSVMDIIRENRPSPIDDEQAYTGRNMRDMAARLSLADRAQAIAAPAEQARAIAARAAEVRGPAREAGAPMDTGAPTYDGFGGDVVMPPDSGSRSTGIGDFFRSLGGYPVFRDPDESARTDARRAGVEQAKRTAEAQRRQAVDDRDAADRGSLTRVSEEKKTETPPPDAERKSPVENRLRLTLEGLKAEREANKEQRKENQLLALMQAGFAMASGRSPSALANITAGGVAGVATLNDLEKVRRAEDLALRREIVETELAGEKMSESRAERQAAREDRALSREQTSLKSLSDQNARYAIAAGSRQDDLRKIMKDTLLPEEDRKKARVDLEAIDRELERRALEESRLSRAMMPASMRQGSGDFRASLVGSPRPTQR